LDEGPSLPQLLAEAVIVFVQLLDVVHHQRRA